MRVMTTVVLLALVASSAGCIANMPDLKEKLGYAAVPPAPPTYLAPIVKAQVNSTTGVVGSPLRFSAEGTRDPQGLPLEYSWSFGDGGSALGAIVTHSYQKAGEYAVHLFVTNSGEASDQALVTVQVVQGKHAPVAAFVATPGNAGDKLTFDASPSSDLDGDALTYQWDFGDGSTSLDQKPSHAYAAPGMYAVKLRVTDTGGLSGDSTRSLGIGGVLVHKTGRLDLTTSDSDAYTMNVPDGATSLIGVLTFDRGAAGSNNLTLVIKDASGKQVIAVSPSSSTPPDPMPGATSIRVALGPDALKNAAPGTWTAQVVRGSTVAGTDYTLDVTEGF